LNIPVEQLSRDNISERLSYRQVDGETVQQFIQALEECEFARYAPGDTKGNMNKVYEKAITAIEKIEDSMKHKSRSAKSMAILLALVLLPAISSSAEVVTKNMADSAYAKGHYQQAAKMYNSLLKQGKSAAVYYNLGNCYYRMEDMTHAVLAYERALRLSPGDEDIRFNLQMAREKTIDKIVPRSEMFFVTWWKALVNVQSADGWAITAIVSLGMAVVLLLIYLFVDQLWLRKLGFFGGAFAVLLFLMANLLAWQQQRQMQDSPGAVVIAPAAVVKSTPAQGGTDLFVLHEGTRVDIIDDTMRDWKEVEMADGKRGWIERKLIERI
jgi:tetratricopeptide (TPR) repeat protein